MFRIVKQPRAWWPVVWSGVDEDGNVVENRIEMRFRLIKVDEFVELMRETVAVQTRADDAASTEEEQKRTSVAFAEVVERIAEDWRHVAAENGEPLVWNRENLTMLMNEPRVFDQTMEAFREVSAGAAEVRQGN
jgi:hypothetical protein